MTWLILTLVLWYPCYKWVRRALERSGKEMGLRRARTQQAAI